ALERFVGMFAFALWDKRDRVICLARDRIGEKPLYYGWLGNIFVFGSELKAIREHPAWCGEINRDTLALFLQYGYIPAPYSIYKNIFKLLPGTFLSLPCQEISDSGKPTSLSPLPAEKYWSARDVAEAGQDETILLSSQGYTDELEKLLKKVIKQQLVADVPVGAFLSGGIDSSAIVALAQVQSSIPVKTFTIGFEEEMFDEAKYAKRVARHLGTDHTEYYVTSNEALEVIPKLPHMYDEPFSDVSQIPTFLIAQLARQHVTVSLSGDGGDELFGGYNRHLWGVSVLKRILNNPRWLRKAAFKGLVGISPLAWNKMFKLLGSLFFGKFKQVNPGEKIHKLAELLKSNSEAEFYLKLTSYWQLASSPVLNWNPLTIPATDSDQGPHLQNFTEQMMYLDMVSYLPDDIMVKVDRATMAASLESRAPFLDHRVVEYAWKIPLDLKICSGQGKWLLRQVLYKYVPRELIERPKMGFAVPIDSWLRGPLRDWAESLLDVGKLAEDQYLDPVPIRKKWAEHISGKKNWQYHLWAVLMFQAWRESQN
ncbi:MAG: asparagine synthase (glutamine-hydrolyzing), partial [Nitrospina sp.]|nr:asparagine synthase (glutamine-hydrolyzing) [Nitrospina sp.]